MHIFGEVSMPVKAGDPAPNLTWTKVIASDANSVGPQNLSGTAVLLFVGPVSINEETLSHWNNLVQQFADKQVNFVWIANEKEELLAPFLKMHPVRGWMVLDPEEQSFKAYGIEGGDAVLINSNGKIAGFTSMPPSPDQIQAVLDGRAVAVKGEPTEAQLDAFFEGKAVRLEAEPSRFDFHPTQKPDLSPSDEVHISPSHAEGTDSSTGPDYWIRRGFELKAIISEISGATASRVDVPAALDNGARYDFVLVPSRDEDEETMNRQVLAGIEKHFHIAVTQEIRTVDVYVMTAAQAKTPPKKSEGEAMGGSVGFSTQWIDAPKLPDDMPRTRKTVEAAARQYMDSPEFRQAMNTAQLAMASAVSSSADEFCKMLEDGLHRPVINETKLQGYYDFKLQGQAQTTEQFLGMMRDQLGLVLTPTQRNIEVTTVRRVE